MQHIAQIKNLSKQYSNVHVLNDVSFHVEQGTGLALLGPNGAGKSTTLSIMQGLRSPTGGSITLFGSNPHDPKVKQRIGMTPQDADFPPNATPREILSFASAHYQNHESIEHLAKTFKLNKLIDRRMRGFSGGERRRVALTLAFIGKPELVFLDEPTAGLDVETQAIFNEYARNYIKNGGTVLLTSHNLHEVEHICAKIVMIDHGKVVLTGSIEEIRKAVSAKRLSFNAPISPSQFSFCHDATNIENRWSVIVNDGDKAMNELINSTFQCSDFLLEKLPLEETLARLKA